MSKTLKSGGMRSESTDGLCTPYCKSNLCVLCSRRIELEECDCVKCFPLREFFYPATKLKIIHSDNPVNEGDQKESMRRQQLNWKSVMFCVCVISAWHYFWV
jgi:hypothetical protein